MDCNGFWFADSTYNKGINSVVTIQDNGQGNRHHKSLNGWFLTTVESSLIIIST